MDDRIKDNLIAAGCNEEFIKVFDSCIYDKRKCEKLLAARRRELLDEIHDSERKISCLDYLVFMMKKENKES